MTCRRGNNIQRLSLSPGIINLSVTQSAGPTADFCSHSLLTTAAGDEVNLTAMCFLHAGSNSDCSLLQLTLRAAVKIKSQNTVMAVQQWSQGTLLGWQGTEPVWIGVRGFSSDGG